MDLRKTIVPKSDQLNADDLISGAMTVKVTEVTGAENEDQPVSIHFEGDNGKPYKPCKSMRRLLVQVWGHESDNYVGRSMTLYRDDSVKFAGVNVGGIRISHVSHIDKPTEVLITVAKSKRRPVTVQPLKVAEKPRIKDFAKTLELVKEGKATIEQIVEKCTVTDEELEQLIKAKDNGND